MAHMQRTVAYGQTQEKMTISLDVSTFTFFQQQTRRREEKKSAAHPGVT